MKGRRSRVSLESDTELTRPIKSIYVQGLDELKAAEFERERFICKLLQGKRDIRDPGCELFQQFYIPSMTHGSERYTVGSQGVLSYADLSFPRQINESQKMAIGAFVTSTDPFVVVQGTSSVIVIGRSC